MNETDKPKPEDPEPPPPIEVVALESYDKTAKVLYKIYREYAKHQYNLINHRTNWYIGLQSFLFAAFGFTIQYKVYSLTNVIGKNEAFLSLKDVCSTKGVICQNLGYLDWMMIFYGVLGITVSLVFSGLLVAASNPIDRLNTEWEHVKKAIKNPVFREHVPNITGGYEKKHARRGRGLTKLLPIIVFFVWVCVLVVTEWLPFLKNASFLRYTVPSWPSAANQPQASQGPAKTP